MRKDRAMKQIIYIYGARAINFIQILEYALQKNDITQEQFKLAIETSDSKKGILGDIANLTKYTKKCFEVV